MKARVAAALAAIAALAGCADLLGFKTLTEADSGPPDVTNEDVVVPEAGPDVTPDVTTCQHAVWPAEPDATASGTPKPYDLAIHHMHFTTTEDGGVGDFGFDLDNRCTVDQASASCKSTKLVPDGPGGIDNASIQLLNGLIGFQPSVTDSLSDAVINQDIADGVFTVLIRIYGLESDQNQTLVQGLTIALQTAPSIVGFPTPPAWDGNDRWIVAASDTVGGLGGGTNAPNKTMNAYVTNGVLVAKDPGPITMTAILPSGHTLSGALPIRVRDVTVTAKLVKRSDGNYDISNGLFAGRWATADLLSAVASLDLSGGALCEAFDGGVYGAVQTTICPKQDITANGPDDDTAACDAVSVAMAFDAVATTVANNPTNDPVSTTPCADAGPCTSSDQ